MPGTGSQRAVPKKRASNRGANLRGRGNWIVMKSVEARRRREEKRREEKRREEKRREEKRREETRREEKRREEKHHDVLRYQSNRSGTKHLNCK